MTLPGILAYSSNVGTIKIADLLGAQKLYEYQLRFGLGKATGVGVPGEAAGAGAAAGELERLVVRLDPDRARRVGDAAADGRRVRGDRQRRHWVQPHLVQAIVAPGRVGAHRRRRRRRGRCCARRTPPRCAR